MIPITPAEGIGNSREVGCSRPRKFHRGGGGGEKGGGYDIYNTLLKHSVSISTKLLD